MKGLDPNAVYKITDFDDSDSVTMSGKELLSKGLPLVILNKSEAKVIRLEKLRK
ncbi:MAG: GH36 C-terminal domain-containing protein [Bacteroidota bacterium]|nr:GH36 C-terminal domain-containing protein [Bacteroidota bacterium]